MWWKENRIVNKYVVFGIDGAHWMSPLNWKTTVALIIVWISVHLLRITSLTLVYPKSILNLEKVEHILYSNYWNERERELRDISFSNFIYIQSVAWALNCVFAIYLSSNNYHWINKGSKEKQQRSIEKQTNTQADRRHAHTRRAHLISKYSSVWFDLAEILWF